MTIIIQSLGDKIKKYSISILYILFVGILLSGCNASASKKTSDQQGFTVRAVWVDPPGFKDKETIDKLVERCTKAGLNTIIPDIMLRGDVWFKSVNFAGKVNADDQFDPLAYLIEKSHAAGIEVHPWSCTYYSVAKDPTWYGQSFMPIDNGDKVLSPAHPEVNPYLLSVLKELLNYDIDGIHLDYTRYWNAAFDYSDAACNWFKDSYGFNPQDFIDHPERIIPTEENSYPIRIICTQEMGVVEMGSIERNMNRTGVGYAFVSEKPENVDALKAPGLLILSYYHHPSDDMLNALERYANRGGDVMWVDPTSPLFNNKKFNTLTGISKANYFDAARKKFQTSEDNPFGKLFDSLKVKIDGNFLTEGSAKVVVSTDAGEPVVRVIQKNKGRVMTVAMGAMDSDSQQVIDMLTNMILGFRAQAGITSPDLMAEKRKQWIEWRASHIMDFARELRKAIDAKNPDLKLTAAAGIGPQNYYSIYRDASDWLVEDIADYIYPMNYIQDIDDLRDMLQEQVSQTPEGMDNRIYPGLYVYHRSEIKEADIANLDKQLELVKGFGYQGFCLFAYSYISDEMIEMVGEKYRN